ncbi:MAG: hypothetical protein R3286_08200 [Gammaproteobacteria bacterium]|nr:hypothetical protein [Gammaproteobacteria bacterium]
MAGRIDAALRLASIVIVAGGAALAAAERRPLWSYHDGNTLFAHPQQYREGYAIGVLDGYLAAHERARESGEGPTWLDICLSGGRTAPATAAELDAHLRGAFREFDQAAADILIDYMQRSCAGEALAPPARHRVRHPTRHSPGSSA